MGAEQRACVHCLRVRDTTDDHVFPASWYPDNTPANVQRLTAPSCGQCNSTFGKMETDLLVRLLGCIDPKEAAASGLHDKALRSLGIGVQKRLSEKEKAKREARRAKLRSEFIPASDVASLPGRIPGLGPPLDEAAGSILFPIAAFSMMTEKIARGCEYNFNKKKRLVEPPYSVLTTLSESKPAPIPEGWMPFCFDFGPGCKITRVCFPEDDPNAVLYWIFIWNTLCVRAWIDLEENFKEVHIEKFPGIELPRGTKIMNVPAYLRAFNG